ncbi:hypothetical protein [Methylotenera sp.]|uniref:hypothetical protein n=1 Tax=Methylotenera sp. TaxID=2051956 RepID=UPI002489D7E2|nr:hypothetical protein [Methylotenera sp.]MDI1360645.1 hypothetical protein [Methylotenera sp.]
MKVSNNNAGGQEILQGFVERHVHHCVSSLMSSVGARISEAATMFDEYEDDLYNLYTKTDWESAARDNGWDMNAEGEIFKFENDDTSDADSWQDACEQDNTEPYYNEALEHWIVSDWLAEKLAEQGEIVGNFANMSVWGRTCSGQAILLDGVISDIYNETFCK